MKKLFTLSLAILINSGAAFAGNAATSAAGTPTNPGAQATAAVPAYGVTLRGATLRNADVPLQIWIGKEKPATEFDQIFKLAGDHQGWKVTKVDRKKPVSELQLKSLNSNHLMKLQIANEMLDYTKITFGGSVTLANEKLGANALVKVLYGKTPIGFIASEGTKIN